MEPVTLATLQAFLRRLGERYPGTGDFYLSILPDAPKADIIPSEFRDYFEEIRRRLGEED